MSHRCLGTAVLAFVGLLAFPSRGHANIIDWIWSMSGPQMVSLGVLHCEFDFEGNRGRYSDLDTNKEHPWTLSECRVYDYRFIGNLRSRTRRSSWLSVDTAGYTSTTYTEKNPLNLNFGGWDHTMFVVEPMFEVRGITRGNLMLNYGVIGASYQVLGGSDRPTLDKFAIKFRPITVTFKRFNASFNMRWYPNGFTADEFGEGPRLDNVERPSEMTWGFSVGYLWGPRNLP
jgi:hypothetical protein